MSSWFTKAFTHNVFLESRINISSLLSSDNALRSLLNLFMALLTCNLVNQILIETFIQSNTICINEQELLLILESTYIIINQNHLSRPNAKTPVILYDPTLQRSAP